MFNNNNIGNFTSDKQRKFYLIMRAFKFGNIFATVLLILFIGIYFLGG
ncbi:MAG: hypothetical protein ACPKQO_07935 [Nitrososphaeraceae archaeon]